MRKNSCVIVSRATAAAAAASVVVVDDCGSAAADAIPVLTPFARRWASELVRGWIATEPVIWCR